LILVRTKIYNMKFKQRLRIIILFTLAFFGEIALSFSDKSSADKVFPAEEKMPLSLRLSNNLSTYESMASFDHQMEIFLNKWNIAGASVAIVKDEKLIYSKGFGYADKENHIKVEPKHVFRIASVSKLITAVAVMKLVEEGKLNLTDTIFGKNGILNDSLFLNIKDKRVTHITVENLLNHTSGWSNRKGDPMFQSISIAKEMKKELPLDFTTVVQYVLEKQKLSYTPGKKSVYSNFGYALLGLVIEKVTNITYEDYVVTQILNPIGIYDMHLGKSLPDEKYPNEVKYYGLKGEKNILSSINSGEMAPRYYGGNSIELLGAAGGWIASSTELMKFLVAIDGFSQREDILSMESVQRMTQGSKNQRPFGWTGTDKNGYWWRTGTLSGTSVLLKREKNGLSWVFIMNTTPKYGSRFPVQINKNMIQGLATITEWPVYDLFDHYELKSFQYKLVAEKELGKTE